MRGTTLAKCLLLALLLLVYVVDAKIICETDANGET